jgi:regulator of sigma E protease
LETVLIKALQLIVALSLLIVLHEGGHFLFAKLFKTRVEKFYLFFDYKFSLFSTYANWFRRLMGKQPVPHRKDKNGKETNEYEYEGTEYGIGWIPLGGYVKISGMIDESMDKEQMALPPQPWEFRTKPAWQRLIIMLGGIFVNFITAFFIYSMVLFCWGEQYVKSEDMNYGMKFSEAAKQDGFRDGDIIIKIDEELVESWSAAKLQDISNAQTVTVLRAGKQVLIDLPTDMNLIDMLQQEPRYASIRLPMEVDSVMPGSPAAAIGLKRGDKITALNGQSVADFNDFHTQLLTLQDVLTDESTHADSLKQRTVTLIINQTDTVKATLTPEFTLGFANKTPYLDKITTREYGLLESFPAGIKLGYETLASYADQMKYIFTAKGARSVGGFIGIGNIFPDVWDWQRFWMLTAFLSIALGFMNALPIPALDGGHAIFAIYEIITRRKPSDKLLERTQYVGMALLIGLMILAQANDILRLFGL